MNIKRNITVQNHSYQVDVPDQCPICHRHSELKYISADLIDSGKGVQATFKCAYSGCSQNFFCYYGPTGNSQLKFVSPIKPSLSEFSNSIVEISPNFISIFSEAQEAAQLGLKQIAGPGYRKAFEFLIKDYAKSQNSDKSQEIELKPASAVVNEFIGDIRIQAVAKRSLWLGNDETHYLRKWTDHDLDDLVTLIKLTVNWIEIGYLSKSYIEAMPE